MRVYWCHKWFLVIAIQLNTCRVFNYRYVNEKLGRAHQWNAMQSSVYDVIQQTILYIIYTRVPGSIVVRCNCRIGRIPGSVIPEGEKKVKIYRYVFIKEKLVLIGQAIDSVMSRFRMLPWTTIEKKEKHIARVTENVHVLCTVYIEEQEGKK